jgi:hypothetical protein
VRATSQGQSAATPDKERKIGSALAISAIIANKKVPRFTFPCFDTNSGGGWNDEADCPGSPLVFHTIADQRLQAMRPFLLACDRDESRIVALRKLLQATPHHLERTTLFAGDNEDAVREFERRIERAERNPHFAVGAVICDPNGYWYRAADGLGAPINTLPGFLARHPRIDLIVNLNMRWLRMARAHPWGKDVEEPCALLLGLRPHWFISRPASGSTDFIICVGRSMETRPHRALGFHDLISDEGKLIIAGGVGGRQGRLDV